MAERFSTTIRLRKLGFELQKIRVTSGIKAEVIQRELEISPAKLSRFETGKQAITVSDLIALLTLYGVSDRIQELTELRRAAREPGWWQAFGVAQGSYVDFESGAVQIKEWAPDLLPIQPEEYCRRVLKALRPDMTAEQRDTVVALRQERRKLIEDPAGPKVWLVLGEGAIKTAVGGRDVMRQTLEYLLYLGELPNVTLQILPFEVGEHAGMEGSFSILDYAGEAPTIGYCEYPTGTAWLERESELARVSSVWDHVQATAFDPRLSVEIVRQLIKGSESEDGTE